MRGWGVGGWGVGGPVRTTARGRLAGVPASARNAPAGVRNQRRVPTRHGQRCPSKRQKRPGRQQPRPRPGPPPCCICARCRKRRSAAAQGVWVWAPPAPAPLAPSRPPHRSGMDISSSTVTGRLTWPEMANSLVPWLFLRPMEENHSGPRRRMVGDTATVSTLVTAGRVGGEGGEGWEGGQASGRGGAACSAALAGRAGREGREPECALKGPRERRPRCSQGQRGGQAAARLTGGGAAVQAHVGGEGRLEARLALLALQGLDQRRLLACRAAAAEAGSSHAQNRAARRDTAAGRRRRQRHVLGWAGQGVRPGLGAQRTPSRPATHRRCRRPRPSECSGQSRSRCRRHSCPGSPWRKPRLRGAMGTG